MISLVKYFVNFEVVHLHRTHKSEDKTRTSITCTIASKVLYRVSHVSFHVLLNLLNELGKSDKMLGLPSIFSPFSNEFNKFNKTRA